MSGCLQKNVQMLVLYFPLEMRPLVSSMLSLCSNLVSSFNLLGFFYGLTKLRNICRCKKLSAARKQMSVYRAPNILVIQLKVNLKSIYLNFSFKRIMLLALLLAFFWSLELYK